MSSFTKLILITTFMIILTASCSSKVPDIDGKQASEAVDNIGIELVSKTQTPKGIEQTMKFTNGSSFSVKNLTVTLSYPFSTNGSKVNADKAAIVKLKQDISPGEVLNFEVFIPFNNISFSNLDLERLNVEMVGYLGKVKDTNRFMKSGDIEMMNLKDK